MCQAGCGAASVGFRTAIVRFISRKGSGLLGASRGTGEAPWRRRSERDSFTLTPLPSFEHRARDSCRRRGLQREREKARGCAMPCVLGCRLKETDTRRYRSTLAPSESRAELLFAFPGRYLQATLFPLKVAFEALVEGGLSMPLRGSSRSPPRPATACIYLFIHIGRRENALAKTHR